MDLQAASPMSSQQGCREEHGRLSNRERVIAERYSAGLTYKQIAKELFIAPTTVRGHLSTIYRKLQIHSKTQLTRLFANDGEFAPRLISPPVAQASPFAPPESEKNPVSAQRTVLRLPDEPSIAVLPFTNMSDDPTQDCFANGITDDLITDLSNVPGLFVIARHPTFVYKHKSVAVSEIAADLGVRYVLEGSVRRSKDTVRVNAQLIDATTDGHVWAERYDGNTGDIFAVQDEFVREIVNALALNL